MHSHVYISILVFKYIVCLFYYSILCYIFCIVCHFFLFFPIKSTPFGIYTNCTSHWVHIIIVMIIIMFIYVVINIIFFNKVIQFKITFTLIYIYIVIIIFVIFIWWSPFIPSRNLDEVFTYNHIWL